MESLLAEGPGDLLAQHRVLGPESFDLGACRVEALSGRLLGGALLGRDRHG